MKVINLEAAKAAKIYKEELAKLANERRGRISYDNSFKASWVQVFYEKKIPDLKGEF